MNADLRFEMVTDCCVLRGEGRGEGWNVAGPERVRETQIEGYQRSQAREGSGNGEEWWIEKLFRAENRQGMEEYLAQDREVLRRNPGLLADAC